MFAHLLENFALFQKECKILEFLKLYLTRSSCIIAHPIRFIFYSNLFLCALISKASGVAEGVGIKERAVTTRINSSRGSRRRAAQYSGFANGVQVHSQPHSRTGRKRRKQLVLRAK